MTGAAVGAQPPLEVLDFEELEPRCVVSSTVGDWGTGPVQVFGTSHRFGPRTNVAIVVDTQHPDPTDVDLSTEKFHNAVVISRERPLKPAGPEAAWLAGSVQTVNDEDIPGATVTFDFTETGLVTFYGLTLLDHNNHPAKIRIYQAPGATPPLEELEAGTSLDLTWGSRPWFSRHIRRARLTPPNDEQPFHQLQVAPAPIAKRHVAVDVRELRAKGREAHALVGRGEILEQGFADVTRIEVVLGGSSAVDRLLFRRQGVKIRTEDEDLFTKIENRIADVIQPQLEELRADFFTRWRELTDNPGPTLRADLDALVVDLEAKLLGTENESGVRADGLLQCPALPCGCPELRALQAWVEERIAGMRAGLEIEEPEAETLAASAGGEVRIAALDPVAYLAQSQVDGRIELARQGGAAGSCDQGDTFWQQFFCESERLFNGVTEVVASRLGLGTRVELAASSVVVEGQPQACEAFRLTPNSPDFSHVETGILPGTSRRVPRGLYCVLCRTARGSLLPFATLDLVEDRSASPTPLDAQTETCRLTG